MSTLTLRSLIAQTLRAAHTMRTDASGMPLAAGSALLALSIAGSAYAQQAPAKADATAGAATLDEIVVTGFRRSIMDSIQVKRESTSIVEVVSAEDIGKLPDSSIAEAIARLPGIAGQRVDGRMNSISVRGFGEDYSATTFNGREQVTIGDNRSVSFDLYPSEIMSGVKVYKTADATVLATGIGGTIDLMSVKPLEAKEGVHIGADYEKTSFGKLSAQAKNTGGRFNGSYVGHFADGKVGAALAVSIMDSPNQEQRWNAWGYPKDSNGNFILGGAKPFVRSSDLKRNTVMGILEAQATDQLKLTVDALYIKYDDQKILKGIEMPGASWGGAYTSGTVVDGFVTSGTWDNHTLQVRNDFERQTANLKSIGFNAKYDINDTWTSAFDASHGQVSRDIFSLESYSGVGRCNDPARPRDTVAFQMGAGNNGAIFTPSLNYADPNLIHLGGAECWGNGVTVPSNAQDGFVNFPHIDDKLSSFKVSATATLGGEFVKSIDLGVNYTNRSKSKKDNGIFLTIPAYPGVASVPSQFLLPNTSLAFIGMGNMLSYDSYALFKSGYYNTVSENLTEPNRSINSWTVNEKITTGYVKLNFGSKLGDVRLDGNLGLQIVKTDQGSDGFAAQRDGTGHVVASPVSGGAKYTNALPSLNAILHVTDDQQLRFGAARTLSRSRMDKMDAGRGYSFNVINNVPGADIAHSPWSGSGSNPALRPVLSDQVDLNYGWYFRKDGFVSAGAFYKRLKDWQVNSPSIVDFSQVATPGGVPSYFPLGISTQPVNSSTSGHVNGIELQTNVPFGVFADVLDGFGFAASATYLNSSVTAMTVDPLTAAVATSTQTVPGLSKRVYNSTLYFEKNGFSARISNNSRSDFLGEVYGTSFTVKPVAVKGDRIWDAQIGYDFSQSGVSALHGLTLTLQIQNLSNAPFSTYNTGQPRQIIDYQVYGRDYLAGFRYNF